MHASVWYFLMSWHSDLSNPVRFLAMLKAVLTLLTRLDLRRSLNSSVMGIILSFDFVSVSNIRLRCINAQINNQ